MTEGGNGCEGFPDASLERESNVAYRYVQGWFNLYGLCTSFDDRTCSCWKSDDDGRSGGEGLVVVDGCEEWEDRGEVRWVTKQESGQRDAEYFSLVRVPLFSCQGMDGNVLIGVVICVWAEIVPQVWEHRGDSRELKSQ